MLDCCTRSLTGQAEGGDCDTVNDNMASAVRLEWVSSQMHVQQSWTALKHMQQSSRGTTLQQYSVPLGSGVLIPFWRRFVRHI